jgi:hypothetical protein
MMADRFSHPSVKIDPLSSEIAEIHGLGGRRCGLGPRPTCCLLPAAQRISHQHLVAAQIRLKWTLNWSQPIENRFEWS